MSEISIIASPSALAAEDLIDEYEKIAKFYRKLKDKTEKCEQEMFQLKRNLQLSDNRETYLNQELESITESHEKELADANFKYNTETQDLRARLTNMKQANGDLEAEMECLKNEIIAIKSSAKATDTCQCVNKTNESVLSISHIEYLEKLEADRMNMLHDIDELKEKLLESMQNIARNETEIENVKDCFECSQENLRSKNQELDEKNQIIDSLQEKIVELNVELAEYKSGNNQPNKKGNSLFAEVDDQRQHMKQILAQQKQQYLKMKREHQEGQLKIRMLQRENADMHREVLQCSQMLQNANHHYKKSLNNTIGFLNDEVNKLQKKLRLTESRLVTLAKENKVTWLESMLEYCKNETETLKEQLYATRLQKCEAEGHYLESEERAARWRFEALKSRCIIVDREMLLEQHNIPFGPLKKIANIVEKYFKDGTTETPNISDEIPLTPLSTIDLSSSTIKKENSFDKPPLQLRTESVSKQGGNQCMDTTEKDSATKIEYDPNKENHDGVCNMKHPVAASSTVVPEFRPISVSSERLKVLQGVSEFTDTEHLIEVIENVEDTSNTARSIQKNSLKSRSKVIVKHIVLKRD